MSALDAFFIELDGHWGPASPPVTLSLVGCGALMLQTDYQRGTKDSDVFQTTELSLEISARLTGLAGVGTTMHTRHKLYLDIVGNGFPFLPGAPRWHPVTAINARLSHVRIVVLDVVDVVVSKLKPFRPTDESDIDAMISRGLVPHERLIERFRSAVDTFTHDARAGELPQYIKNLNRVERDMLGVEETEIELPSWV